MEKVFNSYETLFIADVSAGEDAGNATVEKFVNLIKNNASEVIEVAQWGKRRLAYPINDKNEGAYVVVTYKAAPDFIAELDRLFNIDESIMRSMTVKLEFEPVAKTAEEAPATEEVVVEVATEVAENEAAE